MMLLYGEKAVQHGLSVGYSFPLSIFVVSNDSGKIETSVISMEWMWKKTNKFVFEIICTLIVGCLDIQKNPSRIP